MKCNKGRWAGVGGPSGGGSSGGVGAVEEQVGLVEVLVEAGQAGVPVVESGAVVLGEAGQNPPPLLTLSLPPTDRSVRPRPPLPSPV